MGVLISPHSYQHLEFHSSCHSECAVVSNCGLVCISLMTNDVKHVFMLLALYIYICIYIYWKNTCSDPFPTLKIGLFVFIISGKSLLYKPFMSKWFANIFTHSMGCLFYFIDDRIPELLFYLSIDLELVPPPLSKQNIKNSVFLRGRKWDEWFSISLIPLPFILYRTEKRQMVERELLQLFFVVTLLAFLFQEFLSNFGL